MFILLRKHRSHTWYRYFHLSSATGAAGEEESITWLVLPQFVMSRYKPVSQENRWNTPCMKNQLIYQNKLCGFFFKGWRCLYCACKKAHYVDNINGYLLLLKRYSFFTLQTFAARYDFDEVLLSLPLGANSHQEHCKNEATGFAKP